MKVKRLHSRATLPTRAYEGDAGYDLYSIETALIMPRSVVKIQTGIAVEIPQGWVGLIKNRSSLGSCGITKTSQVIDSGYRGELVVILANLTQEPYTVSAGSKVAQLVVCPCLQEPVEEVQELSTSERGTSGFGSSGS